MEWKTAKRIRLVGKQPDPEIPQASQKRVARAHKDTVEHIHWSPSELEDIQQSEDWRHRQRVEKRLLRNRTAEADGKHVILPFSATVPAKCRDCLKEASSKSGISRFLNEKCGGTLDIGTQRDPHASHDSVRVMQRQQMVEKRNRVARNGSIHILCLPQHATDELKCEQCGELAPHSWRRFTPFAKQQCLKSAN